MTNEELLATAIRMGERSADDAIKYARRSLRMSQTIRSAIYLLEQGKVDAALKVLLRSRAAMEAELVKDNA